MSFVICGIACFCVLCLTFLIHEIGNVPFEDCIDAGALFAEIDRQRLEP